MALLAVECEAPGIPPRVVLDRTTAEALVEQLAADLASHLPDVRALDLVAVGALYDQAQLLRPQWPLHAALGDALTRLPTQRGARVIAVGAHAGRMPVAALEPDHGLLGSPMLVLPWLLAGPPDMAAAIGRQFEQDLLERGLAGAALALALGDAFGVRVTHARHMTTFDLCALASAQYEHAGLGALWQIIEAALLAPDRAHTATLPNGDLLHWHDGAASTDTRDPRQLAQCRAILAAHGLVLTQPA